MKNVSKFILGLIVLMAVSFSACEKETTSPAEVYSIEVEEIFAQHQYLMAKFDYQISISKEDIEASLATTAIAGEKDNCSVQCCYTTVDLTAFLGCWGYPDPISPECLENGDLNCDGAINILDYLIIMTNFGCQSVDPGMRNINGEMSFPTNSSISSNSLWTSQIRNSTMIDGVVWQLSPNTIDEARWYYDGVLVSTNIGSLQLQYPGAAPTDYDVAIDCNHGLHEVTLEVEVDCHVYSTTNCITVKMLGVTSTCASDYCTN